MREGIQPNRKSERLRVSRGESTRPNSAETSTLGAEVLQVFVAEGGNSNRKTGRPVRSTVPEPDLVRRNPVEEQEDAMTRLKYNRFKGDGSQDADDWLCEFESTALANQENESAHQRIFQGLLKGEALRWYQDIPDSIRNDWGDLRKSFLQAFREVGGEARALGRLSTLAMRSSKSVRMFRQGMKESMLKGSRTETGRSQFTTESEMEDSPFSATTVRTTFLIRCILDEWGLSGYPKYSKTDPCNYRDFKDNG
jgi:hypothetical protein